jgi:(1->4)-alpha-D-glucan 1-alpha-D-glucosylmutase
VLIYQTLLAAWPIEQARLAEFLVKALREAKQNSSWLAPREEYEQAVCTFAEQIVADEERFLPDFREFQAQLARHGARNALGQLVLKIAAPGVADFYQGTELWQFTLVDPDNRRPVDYQRRTGMLEELRRRESEDRIGLIRELAADPQRNEMKLWVTYKGLALRKQHREMFARGDYLALDVMGTCAAHVVAFARRLGEQWAVVVAPRWTSRLGDWGDTAIALPGGAPSEWVDALTGLIPASWRLADLLREFPVALLSSAPA